MKLDHLFNPRSVAIVGASPRAGSVGRAILENLMSGFKGKIYPVNPKYKEILELTAYKSVLELPEPPELVVITVRANLVPAIVEESGRRGAKVVIVVSGGFAESGREGAELERRVVSIARRYGMRLVGPNCIGVYDAVSGVDTFFIPRTRMRRPPVGSIAVVSQSGAFLTTFMDYIASEGVGIVRAINIGNKTDVDEVDVLAYLADKDDVNVIMMYLEDVKPGRGQDLIREILRAREKGKRVVILKGGKTESGHRAASTHTAALAGDYKVFSAAMRQAGAIETGGPVEFLDAAKALARGRLPRGRRVAVVTHAGGPGVISTDLLSSSGLLVPEFPRDVQERLRSVFPPRVAVRNPVDLTGDATADDYRKALDIVLASDVADMVYVIAYIQPPTIDKSVGHVFLDAQRRYPNIPIIVVTGGSPEGEELADWLAKNNILEYTRLEGGVYGAKALFRSAEEPCTSKWMPATVRNCSSKRKLLEHEALDLAAKYGLAVPRYCLARSIDDVDKCVSAVGSQRLVAKVVSPVVSHKSDIGGVILGIETVEQARNAFDRIKSSYINAGLPPEGFYGVLFMEMIPDGTEMFIGGKYDPFFGPVILAGSGGLLVELVRDVAVRVAPLNRCETERMLRETKVYRLLSGYRGVRGSLESVVDAVQAVSTMMVNEPIAEIDINPLIVGEDKAYAVDVRIVMCENS